MSEISRWTRFWTAVVRFVGQSLIYALVFLVAAVLIGIIAYVVQLFR